MRKNLIRSITEAQVKNGFCKAYESPRKRYAHILHEPGAEFNEVFNFLLRDSYMQPHLHPGDEKCEEIFLVKGRLALLLFDDGGGVARTFLLEQDGFSHVIVPAFTWHTYVMLTDEVLTYETMSGQYDPSTWKKYASWAAIENSLESETYLRCLKSWIKQENPP